MRKDNKLTKKCMAISDFIRLRKLGEHKSNACCLIYINFDIL